MDTKSNATVDTQNEVAGGQEETAANMAARKKITVEEAQRLITEKRVQRTEEERKKAIEDEKRRRIDGQKMAETRQELQDQERIRLAQQIRREKLEKEAHHKKVLAQIAADREAMANRNKQKQQQPGASASKTSTSTTPTTTPAKPRASSTECRLALRFPDGSTKVQKFSPQEQLAAVRLFVQTEKPTYTSVIEFVAPPNKKLSGDMMDQTLESLGLCPASRLEVKFTGNPDVWEDLD